MNTYQSFLERLNPITKLIVLITLTVMIFLASSIWQLFLLLLYVLSIFFLGKIQAGTMKWLFVPFLVSLPITISVFVISFWVEFMDFQLGLEKGFSEATVFLLRIAILLVANIIFIKTTDVRKFSESPAVLKIPQIIVVLITTVFRFFPVIIEEGQRIIDVQRTRGMRPVHLLRPHHFLPIVVPLLLINMQRAHEMALSMHLRGGFMKPTHTPPLLNGIDTFVYMTHGGFFIIIKFLIN